MRSNHLSYSVRVYSGIPFLEVRSVRGKKLGCRRSRRREEERLSCRHRGKKETRKLLGMIDVLVLARWEGIDL